MRAGPHGGIDHDQQLEQGIICVDARLGIAAHRLV
jgi:hypothetical protein